MLKVIVDAVKYKPSLNAFSFYKKDLMLLADMIRDQDAALPTNGREVMMRVDYDEEEAKIEVLLG